MITARRPKIQFRQKQKDSVWNLLKKVGLFWQ